MLESELQEARKILLEHGIKPSLHKVKMLRFLLDNRIHPTAEEIYKNVKKLSPTISKTTVYNIMKVFVEKGIVKIIRTDIREARYDINTSPHIHFKCLKCNTIFDIPYPSETNVIENLRMLPGFVPQNIEITIDGICANCNNPNNFKVLT